MKNLYTNLYNFKKGITIKSNVSYQDFLNAVNAENDNRRKTTQGLKANVLENKVVFERIRPLIGNIFKPYFYCTISENGPASFVLKGVFRMKKATRIFISSIVTLLIVVGVIMLPVLFNVTLESESRLIPLIVLLLAGLVIVLASVGKKISRSDVEWILNRVGYLAGLSN